MVFPFFVFISIIPAEYNKIIPLYYMILFHIIIKISLCSLWYNIRQTTIEEHLKNNNHKNFFVNTKGLLFLLKDKISKNKNNEDQSF